MTAKQPPWFKYLTFLEGGIHVSSVALLCHCFSCSYDAMFPRFGPFAGVTVVLRETYKFHLSNPYTDTYNVRPPQNIEQKLHFAG